jgi:hypothetical protein
MLKQAKLQNSMQKYTFEEITHIQALHKWHPSQLKDKNFQGNYEMRNMTCEV